jgi:hypothetical protein
MSPNKRRAAARRKAWGRGPMILRFEPLEGRQLLSGTGDATSTTPPDATVTTIVNPIEPAAPAPKDGTVTVTAVKDTTTTADSVDPGAGGRGEVVPISAPAPEDTPEGVVTIAAPASSADAETTSTPAENATTITTPAKGRPDLSIASFGTSHNLDWGQTFQAQGTLRNEGTATVPAGTKVDVYASPVPTLGPSAVYVGTAVVNTEIPPGGTGSFDAPMMAPPLPLAGLGSAPSYYLIPRADGDGTVNETNEANNGGELGGPTSVVTITPQLKAKLEATAFLVSPNTLTWGKTLTVKAQITNVVPGSVAPATRARVVLYPKGQSATGPAAVTIGEIAVPSMTAYPPANLEASFPLPATPPAVLANSSTFNVSIIPDADFVTATPLSAFLGHGNGRDTATVTILPGAAPLPVPARPEVNIARLQPVTDTATWGQPLQVRATIENDGTADATRLRVRFALTDANRPNTAPLAIADTMLDNLPAGYKQDIVQTIPLQGPLPAGIDPATIAPRVLAVVDPENTLDESNELNNQLVSGPVTFKLLTKEGTRTDVPATPGPVATPPQTTPPNNQPPPTKPTDTTTGPKPNTPTPGQAPTRPDWQQRRLRLAQLRAERQAARAQRRALILQLRATQPRLRVVPGTDQVRLIDRGGKRA